MGGEVFDGVYGIGWMDGGDYGVRWDGMRWGLWGVIYVGERDLWDGV